MDFSRVDWAQVVATALGSGALTGLVGLWIKSRFDSSLAKQSASLQTELEVQKAFLQRASRVHEWQVERLCKLYGYLFDAQNYNRRITATTKFANEVGIEEYTKRLMSSLGKAEEEFAASYLLLPSEVSAQIDSFFRKMLETRVNLGIAHLIPPGTARANTVNEAQKIAHEEIPALLRGIETEARRVIEGEKGKVNSSPECTVSARAEKVSLPAVAK